MKTNKILKKAAATMKAARMQTKEIERVQKAESLADAVDAALDARHTAEAQPIPPSISDTFTPTAPGGYRLAAVGTVTAAQQKANLKDAQGNELSYNDAFDKLMGRKTSTPDMSRLQNG